MKKTFHIFLTIFLLSFFVLPDLSLASIVLTTTALGPTSVTLNATGLAPGNSNATFTMHNFIGSSTTPTYFQSNQGTISSVGVASANFSGLSPSGQYVGTVNYTGNNATLGTLTFPTPAGVPTLTTTAGDLGQNTATFKANNLLPNVKIIFNIKNYDSGTPTLSQSWDTMSDNTGLASYYFMGLTSGGHYTTTINYQNSTEILATANFYTVDNSTTPSPDGGNGGNNNGGGGSTYDGSLVPCGTTKNATPCGFNDLFSMVNKVINFVLFVMAVPIAAIMFAYAGFMLVTSGGSSEQKSKAKSVFFNVAVGLIIAAAAWLIVHTILNIAGADTTINWLGL